MSVCWSPYGLDGQIEESICLGKRNKSFFLRRHLMRLERYREDQHCPSQGRHARFEKWSKFFFLIFPIIDVLSAGNQKISRTVLLHTSYGPAFILFIVSSLKFRRNGKSQLTHEKPHANCTRVKGIERSRPWILLSLSSNANIKTGRIFLQPNAKFYLAINII